MTKVYLIGMPGSGKTTLARELAAMLNVSFVDLDQQVMNREKMTIPEIFDLKGEAYFRTCESQELRAAADSDENFVMATGGGTPCFHEGITVMHNSGKVIFIDTPTPVLAERVWAQGTSGRPMFSGLPQSEVQAELQRLRGERLPYYSKAHWTVGSESQASDIVRWLKKELTK